MIALHEITAIYNINANGYAGTCRGRQPSHTSEQGGIEEAS